jgi:hypothetical protein
MMIQMLSCQSGQKYDCRTITLSRIRLERAIVVEKKKVASGVLQKCGG